MNNTDLTGRAAVVTGAGAGLGRAEALALAARGAHVVVNDVGDAADTVVAEIDERGGNGLAVKGDVSNWEFGAELVAAAVDTFGSLDIVVNNAGITRDTMLFNLTEAQWDDVIEVHLKGHAALSHAAAAHWRAASKAVGGWVYGRVVNTASEAFLFGAPGQANYAAAKAGIVALTLSTARTVSRYGATANAVCPRARTDMTSHVFDVDPEDRELDILAPERVASLVAYLSAPASARINGQVFVAYGDMVALMAAPTVENKFIAESGTFSVGELDAQLSPYFADRPEWKSYAALSVAELDTTGVQNKVP